MLPQRQSPWLCSISWPDDSWRARTRDDLVMNLTSPEGVIGNGELLLT